ncbi:MAG: MiaB/RimO family radical SAM methylthiotransferase [Acidobacteriaceae bacterium]
MAGYHVENFGCRANHADGDAIAAAIHAAQGEAASGTTDADVVIVNTCSVTAQAEQTARAFLRRVRRSNPHARLVVTGCYAQRAPQGVAALPGVSAVIGNSHKALVAVTALGLGSAGGTGQPDLVSSGFVSPDFVPIAALLGEQAPSVLVDSLFAHADLAATDLLHSPVLHSPVPHSPRFDSTGTRPNLKVQDGCDNRCSFCIIPATRGHSRSLPLSSVLDRVHQFVDDGGQELVLSGINLGRWGRDVNPAVPFEHLIAAILEQTQLPRLRLSSIEPMDWSALLLDLYRTYAMEDAAPTGPRLARHAHLPLQSGCDRTLRAMHRRYRPWHYEEKILAIRAAMPDAAIGADVMAGYPGETDSHFEESYRFIERLPFTYLHLFPFSARPGTPGWDLHRQAPVPSRVVKERLARLQALIANKARAHRAVFIGRTLPVITLKTPPEEAKRGSTRAISDNFLPIELEHEPDWIIPANRMLCAHITSCKDGSLRGSPSAIPFGA